MIEYRFAREKELLLEYAAHLEDLQARTILECGSIENAADARALARFYWRMVDASLDDDIEDWLERIYNTLTASCAAAGYRDIWNEEIPDA